MTTLSLVADGKSERDKAIEIRDAIRARLADILPLMDDANRLGARVEFNLVVDPFGRNQIARCDIIKVII